MNKASVVATTARTVATRVRDDHPERVTSQIARPNGTTPKAAVGTPPMNGVVAASRQQALTATRRRTSPKATDFLGATGRV